MIAATSLTRVFDRTVALRDVTLTIEPGEMFALIGSSGAGKTTFFRIVSGLLHPTSGRLTVTGHKTIGVVPQRFSLYPDLSIDENLTLRAKLYNIDASTAKARGGQLLERVGLAQSGTRLAGHLSGGLKQKLALVAALLTKPDLLLLDEPTSGVDLASRRELWQMLHELHRDGLTIVVSTPNIDEVEYATRVAILCQGRLLDVGTRAEMFERNPHSLVDVQSNDRVKMRGPSLEDVFVVHRESRAEAAAC